MPAAPWLVLTHLKRWSDSGKAEIPLLPDIMGSSAPVTSTLCISCPRGPPLGSLLHWQQRSWQQLGCGSGKLWEGHRNSETTTVTQKGTFFLPTAVSVTVGSFMLMLPCSASRNFRSTLVAGPERQLSLQFSFCLRLHLSFLFS